MKTPVKNLLNPSLLNSATEISCFANDGGHIIDDPIRRTTNS